jgi:hypothetical protein
VKREDGWWCCFAHYGAENHRTTLVQYGEGFDRALQRKLLMSADRMPISRGIARLADIPFCHAP